MNKFIITLLLAGINHAFAQTGFQQLYGGVLHERAQNAFPYSTGYLVSGTTGSFGAGNYDACLLRVNSSGQLVWSKTYGNNGFDNTECTIKTFDNNIICAGRTELIPGSSTTSIIFKTDSSGNILWSKSYGINMNSSFANIIETNDHGYAAVGYIDNSGNKDIYLVRTDVNGDTIFCHSYSTPVDEAGIGIVQATDNSFYLSGRIMSAGLSDAFVMHIDPTGNVLWMNRYGAQAWDELNSVKISNDSSLIIVGGTTSTGNGGYDIFVVKTDLQGNVLWSNTYGGLRTDAAYDVRVLNNAYIIAGYTESYGSGHSRGNDSINLFLMKTDYSGNVLWAQTYGDGLQDEGFHCELDNDGGFLLSAFTTSYLLTDSTQMLLVKTDSLGISGCHEQPAFPVPVAYSFSVVPDVFIMQNIPSTDTLILTENQVVMDNDDACLFANINKEVIANQFSLFPNPANEILYLENNASGTLIIRTVVGLPVLEKQILDGRSAIEISGLSPGYYVVELITAESTMSKAFFVVH